MFEAILVWAGTVSYGASSACFAVPSSRRQARFNFAYFFLVLGVNLLVLALALRWLRLGQGPFMTLYEVLVSNAFSVGLIYALLIAIAPSCRNASVLVLPFLLVMLMWALSVSSEPVPLPATFDNPWLWLHVISGKIFLGFCSVAASLAGVLLIRCLNRKRRSMAFENQSEKLDELVWRLMAIAFIADSIMLVVGAVWAYDAWGRYWAWDPLETWALVTWLFLGAGLHLRLSFNIPPWTGWILVMLVFVLAFLTFFGVPFFSLAPHKGVF